MRALLPILLLFAACADAGGERISIPLAASGVPARPVTVGDARVTLTRADVALGPMYLCASNAGRAELCEVALAELREAVRVNALDPAPQPLGVLIGVSGEVRSSLYDFGISWLITQPGPRPLPGAIEGHSAVFEGAVEQGGRSLRFRVDVDVRPRVAGDAALNAQRTQEVLRAGSHLTLQLDPHPWIDRIDVAALFALDTDGDGVVVVPMEGAIYESILQGMVSRAPPQFAWAVE